MCSGELVTIRAIERVTCRDVGLARVDHHRDVASGWRDRHRPGPPIVITLDDGVRGPVFIHPRVALPHANDRRRPCRLLGATKSAARDDTGAPATIENPARPTGRRSCG